MLIECVINRDGPTDQHIGGVRYVFKPRPELTEGDTEARVCEVQKDEIVEYLLQNPNFRQYLPTQKKNPEAEAEMAAFTNRLAREIQEDIVAGL